MIGPIVCSAALALGGICGVLFGSRVPKRVKETLPLVFGVVTIGIGTTLVGKSSALHVVVLALMLLRASTALVTGDIATLKALCGVRSAEEEAQEEADAGERLIKGEQS